jgi:hypothetical protein
MFKALKRQQAQLEVQARRNRLATFTEPIKVEGDEEEMDLKEFLGTFYRSIYNKRRDEIQLILQSFPSLDNHYRTLVPSRLTFEDFWQRYFYRCDVDRVLRQWARKEELTKNEPSGGGLTASLRGFKQFILAAPDTTVAKSKLVQEEVLPKKLLVTLQEEVQPKKLDFSEAPKNEVKPPVQTASTGRAAAKKAQSAVAADTKETEPTLSEESSVATASTGRAAAKKAQSAVAADTKETEPTLSEESSVATPSTGRAAAKKAQSAVAAEMKETEPTLSEESSVATASTGRAAAKKAQSAVAAETKETEPTLSEESSVATASTGRAAAKRAQSAVAAEMKETEPTLSEESSIASPQTIQVMAAALRGILSVVVSVVFLSTSSPSLGNSMCAPVLPYRTLSNESTSLEAPWWAPSSVKAQAFDITCGSRLRTRLDWTFIGKNDNGLHQLTVVYIANDARPLMKRRRATSLQIRSSYMLISNQKGEQEEIAAPWIMA